MVKRISSRFGDMFDYNLTPSQRSQLYEQDTKEGMGLSINPYAYDKNKVYSYAVPEPVYQPMSGALTNPTRFSERQFSNGETILDRVNTDSAFPYEVENRDARVGGGFTYGTGMGPSYIDASPNNEVVYPPNSAMMQREINQGLLSNPNFDLTSFYESPPNNEGAFPPNSAMMQREINQDFDLTKYYESPVNYDMTSFYESPNTVAGVNTVQEVEDVQKNNRTSIIDSIVNSAMGVAKSGPLGTAYSMIKNPSFPDQAIPGALAMAGGFSMIPGGGILGLLGGALNAMGAYHDFGSDPNVGQVSYQNGLLSAPTSAPGGYIYQDGYLSNLNSLNSMNPNTAINVGGGNGYATAGDLYQGLAQTGAGVQGEDYDRQTSFGGDGDDSGGFSEGTSYGDEDSYG